MIGTAIGTALLPTISEQAARKDFGNFQKTVNNTLRVIMALTIPLAAILIAGIHPIIPILGFDPYVTETVVWVTRAYMLGLVGLSIQELAARSFYAQQDARTPLIAIIGTALGFFLLAILFAGPLKMGAPGIALANTIAFTIQSVVMIWLLDRKFPGIGQVKKTFWRVLIVAIAGGGLVHLALRLLPLNSLSMMVSILATGVILVAAILLTIPFIWSEIKLLLKL